MAQKALEMGLEGCLVEKTILGQIQKTGDGYITLEALLHDCFKGAPDSESPVSNEQEGECLMWCTHKQRSGLEEMPLALLTFDFFPLYRLNCSIQYYRSYAFMKACVE